MHGYARLGLRPPMLTTHQPLARFDAVTRRNKDSGALRFFSDIAVVLIDEIHSLNDSSRGPCLEAIGKSRRSRGTAG